MSILVWFGFLVLILGLLAVEFVCARRRLCRVKKVVRKIRETMGLTADQEKTMCSALTDTGTGDAGPAG